MSTAEWQAATDNLHRKLAEKNAEHFSPSNPALVDISSAPHGSDNKTEWEKHHKAALDKSQAGSKDEALQINAFGDHFLTDAFAAGHLINKRDVMEKFKVGLPTLRLVFRLVLRQAEGFTASVLRLLHLDLPIPDHTTLSRRGRKFAERTAGVAAGDARHIVTDSTGLQVFGYGAWHGEKYGHSRRSWRTLHIVVDASTGEILASTLTDNGGDDAGEVPDLLAQVQGPIASVTADCAYDHDAVYQAVAARQPQPPPEVVIPPRATAVVSRHQTQRDAHISTIAERGRMAWRKTTGYGRRNLAETAIGRYKALIGPTLRARNWRAQKAETVIAVSMLNRMIQTA